MPYERPTGMKPSWRRLAVPSLGVVPACSSAARSVAVHQSQVTI